MKKNISINVCILLASITFAACSSKKGIVKPNNAGPVVIAKEKGIYFNKLLQNQTNYSTFSTKAISKLAINDKEYDATLNIRIKKGEVIWVSVTAFAGIEVARAFITPDSIKVLDRLNDEYINKPFSYINDYSNNDIDYATLEAMLVGNLIPLVIKNGDKIILKNGLYLLKDKTENMFYQVDLNKDFKTQSLLFLALNNTQKLNSTISNYEKFENYLLPINISINSTAIDNKIDVKMEYSKTQLNLPLDFPFNVPKRFSVID
jgi:hypothetical protein